MTKLVFLGTSNAIPDEKHENTYFTVVGENKRVLIDCGNNPIVKLQQAGLNVFDITDLIITHFHPDHVGSLPNLLMGSWLLGRTSVLNIFGLEQTLERIQKIMAIFEWEKWPDFYPINFRPVSENGIAAIIESEELTIHTSLVHHILPAIGLRIECKKSGGVAAYSCDTEPCDEVVRLGCGAKYMIHEATGEGFGHSSAAQAGETAWKAGAKNLYLIHYPTGSFDSKVLVSEAERTFQGPVHLAEDLMELEL